jgi:hypothetical protein
VPDRALNTLDELEKRIGTMDNILGPIPKQEELLTEIKSIEEEIKAESTMSSSFGGKGDAADLASGDAFSPPARPVHRAGIMGPTPPVSTPPATSTPPSPGASPNPSAPDAVRRRPPHPP